MEDENKNSDADCDTDNNNYTFSTGREMDNAGIIPTPFNCVQYHTNDIKSYIRNEKEPELDIDNEIRAAIEDSHELNNQRNPLDNIITTGGEKYANHMSKEETEIPSYDVTMSEIDDLLTALTVLASLKEYDKLTWIEDDVLIPNVQVPGVFRFIRRIYNSQNRINMIDKLKKIIYKSISAFKYSSAKIRLKTGLMSCITGLNNLASTYCDDRMISSQIIIIIQNIQKSISE
tara:strand:- start:1672 stop:2367 length:696 start_codon:yes stop_codon:yes gene_type:complete